MVSIVRNPDEGEKHSKNLPGMDKRTVTTA